MIDIDYAFAMADACEEGLRAALGEFSIVLGITLPDRDIDELVRGIRVMALDIVGVAE